MSGFKTLTWRTLSVAALLLSANVASADVVSANALFGLSSTSDVNRLTVDGAIDLYSGANQGWWSETWDNTANDNANYLVGSLEDEIPGSEKVETHYFNNFFVFDLSDLTAPVSSAVLNLRYYTAFATSGASSFTYGLFDVSTAIATVNQTKGTSLSLFEDLGSGKNYGKFLISTGFGQNHVLSLTLNSAGLEDLNAAIDNKAGKFVIGGTLLAPEPVGRSVPDSASTLALFGAAVASLWAMRRKQSA